MRSLNGRVLGSYRNLVEARVPAPALVPLSKGPAVRFIRPPSRPVLEPRSPRPPPLLTPLLSLTTAAVSDEGVQASGAAAWHADGIDGAGIKIGITDGGFRGYRDRQASGDLPANLVTQDYCAAGEFDGPQASEHGAAVAEIIHKMAPAATLYLVCINTAVALGQGEQWLKSQGVQIVNLSGGFFNSSRGDGSGGPGTPDAIVADARASGVLWVNAAGNEAEQHWSGTFVDTNGDDILDYTPSDEGNSFYMPAGASICVFLKWDDWPASAQDYDLFLVRSSTGTPVAASTNLQTGSQQPTEGLCYENVTGLSQNFYIAIGRYKATTAPRFDLFVDAPAQLQYSTSATSVGEPASSPSAMAVGANCWQSDSIEFFSSPRPDDRRAYKTRYHRA